jgi:hypothetical protein
MRRFLQEAWELWYWAMFCPSKLHERMNNWGQSSDEPVRPLDILLLKPNRRFVDQYFLVVIFLSLPILFLCIFSAKWSNIFLFPVAVLIAYCTSIYSFLIGINWPILLILIHVFNPNFNAQFLPKINEAPLAAKPYFMIGVSVGIFGFGIVGWIARKLAEQNRNHLGQIILILGGILSPHSAVSRGKK